MLRRSRSSRLARRRSAPFRGWRGAAGLALAASLGLAPGTSAEQAACGPFEAAPAAFQIASAEPGVAPATSSGAITALPEPVAAPLVPPRGEALLALPKDASGALPTDFELAPGARIAASYWSPILCATVARIIGPETLAPEALVPRVPSGAAVVANQVYATAQEEIRPMPPPAPQPDPYRPLQYGLDQLGSEAAQRVSTGVGVRVAILDSAPAPDHADLGPIETVALEGGPSAQPGAHGTLVAGVVAATAGNGFGIAGVAPGVNLLALPVCTPVGPSASDRCLLYDLLRGLDLAFEREASVMNLSLVGPDNALLSRSVSRLDELGVLLVAAAGNEGTSEPRYPAAYPSVIGVGASDSERRVHARSNRGLSAELYAPGVEVLSTVPGDAFAFGTGTSFAASHVSGSLALLLGAGATPEQARAALFRASSEASEGSDVVRMPALCDVLARLGKPCAAP